MKIATSTRFWRLALPSLALATTLLTALTFNVPEAEPNTLTKAERRDGWQLLFDGKTSAGWRGAYKETFPQQGWSVQNGEISVQKTDGRESQSFGDIVTTGEYTQFDLRFEFKLTDGANSGLKYFVAEESPKPAGSAFGLEYQVLDDERHPDAKMGRNGNRTVGSLYDLMPAVGKQVRPNGEWNSGRVLVQGAHVEHWLNDRKVIEYERGSDAFRQLVAQSKYAAPSYNANGRRFGEATKGHILLQDHGDSVAFRNIKIKPL